MRGRVFIAVLALVGLLSAASIGYAAYLVSRDSVGLPVTKLQPAPNEIAPQSARRKRGSAARTQTRGVTTRPVTTVDDRRGGDRRGRGRDDNSGSGSGSSGSSGSGSSGGSSGGSGSSGHGGGDD
jgi:uncharacterized membrane protein YgcG